MKNLLFISDKLFLEDSNFSGGVKLCTNDYLKLLCLIFNVEVIGIKNEISFLSRIKIKLGIDAYLHYDNSNIDGIIQKINSNKIEWIALNMSNLIPIAQRLKILFPTLKIILLSHGNESGDYLHEISRNNFSNILHAYKLGSILLKESQSRKNLLDFVFTVSPIEAEIEKWINAKKVIYIPRTIEANFIDTNPLLNKVGFIGDLSHLPNTDAIEKICESIEASKNTNIEFCLIGKPVIKGQYFSSKYSFVNYKGYLSDNEVINEVKTWSAFLNLLFYYSRGVSTKLGFALSLGLPVISTKIGLRGYEFLNGTDIISSNNPNEIVQLINNYCTSEKFNLELINISHKAALNSIDMTSLSKKVELELFDNYKS